jgi:hypothetical protein
MVFAGPLRGIVVSNKMMKSVTVMVERTYKHPKYGKYVRGRKKYMVRRAASHHHIIPPAPSPTTAIEGWSFHLPPT